MRSQKMKKRGGGTGKYLFFLHNRKKQYHFEGDLFYRKPLYLLNPPSKEVVVQEVV